MDDLAVESECCGILRHVGQDDLDLEQRADLEIPIGRHEDPLVRDVLDELRPQVFRRIESDLQGFDEQEIPGRFRIDAVVSLVLECISRRNSRFHRRADGQTQVLSEKGGIL